MGSKAVCLLGFKGFAFVGYYRVCLCWMNGEAHVWMSEDRGEELVHVGSGTQARTFYLLSPCAGPRTDLQICGSSSGRQSPENSHFITLKMHLISCNANK